ncbi:uncharacterized protein LOC107850649 isoform X1 [Capsicum annuum]|uniref:uncharacterized protein LOC107850649 isoform X1 n=1 Tax=Capsicum annuum TaxID=4072 RepID=UPI001FB04E78|nr:uncharacterized protein LOC107850649 isoform X1 [Capsicum annuum]
MANTTEKSNGEVYNETTDSTNFKKQSKGINQEDKGVTLFDILNNFISAIFNYNNNDGKLIERIKGSISENVPLIQQASKNTAHNVYAWTRKGSSFRALLVVSFSAYRLNPRDTCHLHQQQILGGDDCSPCFDRIASLYGFLCRSNCQRHCDLSSHVISGCRRILGSFLCLPNGYLYWRSIGCCICHFHYYNHSNFCCDCGYRLDRILLDNMAGHKEKRKSCQALIERDRISTIRLFFLQTGSTQP